MSLETRIRALATAIAQKLKLKADISWVSSEIAAQLMSARASVVTGLVRRCDLGAAAFVDWDALPANLFVRAVGASETLTRQDHGRLIAAAGTVTLTLPAAAELSSGWCCWVKNSGSGTVTVQRAGADTLDGGSALALAAGERRLIVWQSASAYLTL